MARASSRLVVVFAETARPRRQLQGDRLVPMCGCRVGRRSCRRFPPPYYRITVVRYFIVRAKKKKNKNKSTSAQRAKRDARLRPRKRNVFRKLFSNASADNRRERDITHRRRVVVSFSANTSRVGLRSIRRRSSHFGVTPRSRSTRTNVFVFARRPRVRLEIGSVRVKRSRGGCTRYFRSKRNGRHVGVSRRRRAGGPVTVRTQ